MVSRQLSAISVALKLKGRGRNGDTPVTADS
jgi:hypothetical protein